MSLIPAADVSRIRRHLYRIVVPFFFGVLLMADAGQAPRTETPEPPSPRASIPLPPSLSPSYRTAAEHLRHRNCTTALGTLEPLARDDSPEAPFARVIQGLYAHSCGRMALAEQRLFLGGGPGSPLQDWRLLALADAAATVDHLPVATAALDKLLDSIPESPLRPKALEQAAARAWQGGDADAALRWIRRARGELEGGRDAEILVHLDVLAWEIGAATGRGEVQRRAGRRLLAAAPERAERLAVEEFFRSPRGELRWSLVLSPDELEDRARSLADLGRFEEAVEALEAVPPGARDFAWYLRTAEILTRDHRSAEALALLAAVESQMGPEARPQDAAKAAALEWEKARASRDLARVYRGRRNLPSAERRKSLERSQKHLRRVVELDPDGELALDALRLLFGDLASEGRFEEVLAILRAARRLDPADRTGADYLWDEGWEAYRHRNYSGAIGYWAELASMYPEANSSRSGRYWTARAYDALGDRPRAREIYREVAAADTTDFYRKHALRRLAGASQPDPAPHRSPGQAPEPWPRDPRLERASLLSELGLDTLALSELAALRAAASPPLDRRAAMALESQILARQGDLRASIGAIRKAFPALGGPHQAAVPPEALRLYYPLAFEETVRDQAGRQRLPLHVLLGMIRQESGFDPYAHSRAGARGLMQLMPATGRELARRLGMNFSTSRLTDPSFNLRLGTTYFRQVLSLFNDNVELALAGYNGGPYRIRRLWRQAATREVDTFLEGLRLEESRIYVKRILVLSDSYQKIYDLAPASRRSASSPPAGIAGR